MAKRLAQEIRMVKHIFIMFLILLSQPLLAQDNDASETASAEQQMSEQENQSSAASTNKGNTDGEDQVFVPSEEISEDAPVAFPVDI